MTKLFEHRLLPYLAHEAASREEYDALEDLNFSTLAKINPDNGSPLDFKYALDGMAPDDMTPARLYGIRLHEAVLEPDVFEARLRVWNTATQGSRNTKAYKEFAKQNAGAHILIPGEAELIKRSRDAIYANPDAAASLMGGGAELTYTWSDRVTGYACKGRVDYVGEFITDIKTAAHLDPRRFDADAAKFFYHARAAWYRDGIASATGEPNREFRLVAVSKTYPIDVAVVTIPDDVLDIGAALYESWLVTVKLCERKGEWPGRVQGVREMTLPGWAVPNTLETGADALSDDDRPEPSEEVTF